MRHAGFVRLAASMGACARLLVIMTASCWAVGAHAQTGPAIGGDALPQLATLGVAQAKAGAWGLAATTGFGVLSPQADGEDSHRRLQGSLAGSVTLLEGLALGLRLDGHYDMHPDDAQGSDDSLVGTPTLRVRMATEVSEGFAVGLDLGLMVPGKDAPSLALDASRAEARALATYSAASAWGVTGAVGFRLDKSGNAAPDLATTRPGDRVSLGLSDFNALLLGVGVWKRWDALELLGEITWNPWLGSGAPSALQSPLHVTGGARYLSSDALAWEVLVDGLLSQRAEPEGNQLASVDPRFSVQLGFRFMSGYAAPPVVIEPEPDVTPEPTTNAPAATTATVRGRVIDKNGTAVADAEITVVGEGYERTARSNADGGYEVADVPLGQATLRVTGRRLQPSEQPLNVVAAGVALDVQPERLAPEGQLRGLVRSFDGKPLAATIAIAPSGQTLTANAEGEFEVGLPPGEYQVQISIAGHGAQTRTVQIEDDGVTLLNVDLKKARR